MMISATDRSRILKGPGSRKGHTLIELITIIIIIGLLAAIVAPRILSFAHNGEPEMVTNMISRLESSLSIYSSRQFLNGQPIAVHNPFDDLRRPPDNYVGVNESVSPRDIPDGCWSWRPTGNWVMYNPKSTIEGGWLNSGEPFIIYQVQPVVENNDTVGLQLTTTDVYSYSWR
jgi:type II secretory pathway pseudopilin PulG